MANDKINKARDLIDEGKYAQARRLLKGSKDPKAKRLMDEIDDLAPAQSNSVAKDAFQVILMGLLFTALFGGIGYVIGTLFGGLIQGVIQTLIAFDGSLNSWWTKIAIGGLLFAFIVLQRLITRSFGSLRKG